MDRGRNAESGERPRGWSSATGWPVGAKRRRSRRAVREHDDSFPPRTSAVAEAPATLYRVVGLPVAACAHGAFDAVDDGAADTAGGPARRL